MKEKNTEGLSGNLTENLTERLTERLTEEQIEKIKDIGDLFEGSVYIEPGIENIQQNKIKDFQSAYSYIMLTFKPYKNIKPCIAYTLINGLSDGWRVNSIVVAYECLRIFNFDLKKAWDLLELYFENSYRKKGRTLTHLRGAFSWVVNHKSFKVSCNKLSRELPCVGSKGVCYKIRGIESKKGGSSMELLENQKALYLKRFIEYGHYLKLSKKACDTYFFLLNKAFASGFGTLFISHREIAKGINDYYQHIGKYLEELKRENLIFYESGKPGLGSKVASEIKILDLTGRAESRAETLFKEAFKN